MRDTYDDFSWVVSEFRNILQDAEVANAVAAFKALTLVIKASKAATMMGLEKELKTATEKLKEANKDAPLSLASGCELFTRFVTKTSLDTPDFTECKMKLIDRGYQFAQKSQMSRTKIASIADRFIRDGATVLTHGSSRVVRALLLYAASQGKRFKVIVTEARPDPSGYHIATLLQAAQIPVTVIMDAGVARVIEHVDLVLTGAEAICENGGIINKLGTFQISIVAHAFKKPFYVAAESFKFTRKMYPLNQSDIPELTRNRKPLSAEAGVPSTAIVDAPYLDYTPPSYISLLFSELGVLTPSAVSDELIKLYYDSHI